jgi:hypothetical protein
MLAVCSASPAARISSACCHTRTAHTSMSRVWAEVERPVTSATALPLLIVVNMTLHARSAVWRAVCHTSSNCMPTCLCLLLPSCCCIASGRKVTDMRPKRPSSSPGPGDSVGSALAAVWPLLVQGDADGTLLSWDLTTGHCSSLATGEQR